MEISVVIPCFKESEEFSTDNIIDLFYAIRSKFSKFEFILVTSIRNPDICNKCISLVNKDQRIKVRSYDIKSNCDLVKFGVSSSNYNTTLLLDLKRYTENKELLLDNLSLIALIDYSDRFNVYSTTSGVFLYARTFDFKRILKVCKSDSLIEYLNVFDYLNFKLNTFIDGTTVYKDLKYFTGSDKLANKLARKRNSKLYSTELCEYKVKKLEV